MATKLKLPSIPVRTPKNRFQSEADEANKIGQRVTIPSLDNMTGILRYVGEPEFKSGIWAGIELDKQGEGKNDGSVQGKRYFTCAPNQGIFIGVNKIIIHPPPLPTKKKPSPTTSATRRSNLPLTRNPSNNTRVLSTSTSSTTSSTNKKRTTHNLRVSSVPSSSSPTTPQQQQSPSPSTTKRSTLTPTTTSTTTASPTPPPAPMTRKKSTPSPATPPPPPQPAGPTTDEIKAKEEEKNQLYEILEKVQRERDTLLLQMKNKETAWERLVSSKESLSLQVEEKELKSQRLARELEEQQLQVEKLQHGLAERDASIAKNQRDDEKACQDQRRIERLEGLVRELQAQIKITQEEQIQKNREHAGAMDQVRREVTASEALTASLEKECEELRRTGLEAIHAYEHSVIQLTQKHELELQQKDQQIHQLDYAIADLKHKQSTLFDDDEQDIETRLKELSQHHSQISTVNNNNNNQVEKEDQRHRLEEQLELTMTELDSERVTITTMAHEIEQLKMELTQSRQQVLNMEQKYQLLQNDFEKELADKKRLIEEADNAFEQQAKAEDEHYQMKLSTMALEKEYNELIETNKQLEADYNNLMDEMLVLEKQDLNGGVKKDKSSPANTTTANDSDLQEKIQLLEKENETHRTSLSIRKDQVNQLSKDLAELESLVENRVFGESELEEQLEAERKKVISLERELNTLKSEKNNNNRNSFKNLLISPTTTTTSGASPTPHQQTGDEDLSKYCELCERYGHDLLQCKSTSSYSDSIGRMYCDNCDDYGNHVTEDCPNQDETF